MDCKNQLHGYLFATPLKTCPQPWLNFFFFEEGPSCSAEQFVFFDKSVRSTGQALIQNSVVKCDTERNKTTRKMDGKKQDKRKEKIRYQETKCRCKAREPKFAGSNLAEAV